MTLLQNQGQRKFIIAEGELPPFATIDLDEAIATKLSKEYPELKILDIQKPKKETETTKTKKK